MEDAQAPLGEGAAGSLARLYASRGSEFLDILSTTLERALPEQVRVARQRTLFVRRPRVLVLRVQLGVWRYSLETSRQGTLIAHRALVIRNVTLGSEEMPVQNWIRDLGTALDDLAQHHQDAALVFRPLQ